MSEHAQNALAGPRRPTHLAMHQSEQHFRHLLEKLPAGAYTCDPDGLITYFNPRAMQLWGRAPKLKDPIDRFCGSFKLRTTAGEPLPHDRCWMALALQMQQGYNGHEIMIERPDGQCIIALAHANPIHDEAGMLLGAVNVLVDITEQKRAEEERRRFEAQLQHAQKLESLGVLAGGIAHDFNNLLTAMLGYANLAAMDLPHESPASAMLREIETAAQRAADLAQQMLAYSGRGAFVTQTLHLDLLVQEMAHLLEAVISKKATLRLDLRPVAIEGDPSQMRQVVMNLITNASDALEGAPGVIGIHTGRRYADDMLLRSSFLPEAPPAGWYAFVEVEDTGCGMSEETVARIFDPFFTTKFTGRGLGLSAVLGIVKGHRGTIKVASTAGQGTRFQVLIPCTSAAPGELPAAPDEIQQPSRGSVLVMEDEEMVRSLTRRILERAGFSVIEAHDGHAGLELLDRHRQEITALVIDLTMPRLDGLEVLHELSAQQCQLPVLVMSGYSKTEVTARLRGLPASGFVQKPFRPREFIDQLEQMLPSDNRS